MPSSRATMTEIVEKSKQLLDSVSLAPRGDDSVLVIVACLRLPAYLGISWRLWFETYHPAEGNYDPLELALVFCGIAFALYFLFLLVNNRRAFVSVESKRAQILLDLLVYSGAYVLTQDPQSDIYYLNILPLLLTVEYFSLQVTVLVAAWVIVLNAAQFAMIPSHSEVFSWASRDFLPRSFVITIIGVAYLVHRRLRNVGDAALDRDREKLVKQARQLTRGLPLQTRPRIQEFEQGLRDYLERADWIRRMLTREANPGLEAFNTHLLGLNATIAEVYSRPEDGYEDAIRNIVEQLSTALDCCAATLRFSDQQRGGEVTLQLFHACGCAARSDAAPQQQLTLDDHSIVVSAYRTRHVQRWSHGRRDGVADVLKTLEFAQQCDIQCAISVPITIDGRIAVATFYRSKTTEFTYLEQALILSVLDYIAVIVGSARFLQLQVQQSKKLVNRMSMLRTFAAGLPHQRDERQILAYTVEQVRAEFHVEVASIFLLRGDQLKRKADSGIESAWFADEVYQPGQSITGLAYVTEEACLVENNVARNSQILPSNLARYSQKLPSRSVRHVLAVPLRGNRGNIGVLRLINKLAPDGGPDPSGFNNDEAEVMVSIGTMVAMAIETAIQLHQFGILLRLADETGRSVSNLQDVLNKICFYACSALNADQSGIVLYEPEENIGIVRAQVKKMEAPGSHSSYQVANHINYPVIDLASNPAVEQMCTDQKPIAIEDAQHDPRLAGDHGLFRIQGIASILLVPLIIDGCVRGSLGIDSLNNRRRFKPEEIELAGLLAAIGAPAIESALRISDADRQSRTDERARIRDDLHDLRGLHGSTVLVELQLAQFRLQALLETPGKLVSGAKRDVRMLLKDVTKTFEQAKFVNDQLLYIMQDLIDPVLAEEGLTAAVDNFIHKHVKHGSPIEFSSNLIRRLEPSVEHTIYRIAQEAVVNAIRHGIRNQPDGVIHVSLVDRDEQVELAITDNGCGFDPDLIRPGALGIYAMRQRAGDLNGRAALTVDSHVSFGTTVRLCVDLSLPQEFEKWPTLS